ncbi:MAG TPA: hypothetical protein VGQ20_08375 [Acidimicrobiales bacterium]|jgi:hypothetical protein|nr:hypothetical protein [Acidimicrobiales bacterium]
MSTKRRIPAPLLVTTFAIVVALVIASLVTGQWWITVLGLVAFAAAVVPIINRR